jgi:hypothetical protein
MPRQIIQTSAPGASDQWGLIGAPTSWEAVLRDSDDSSYIRSQTAAQVSDFFCGAGYTPVAGRVMAVTMHYRMRGTTAGGSVDLAIVQSGTPQSVGTVSLPTTAWVEGSVRVREDWTSSTRFTSPDVAALGVEVTVNTVAPAGWLEVSKLWLEVEVVDHLNFYDPYDGVLPTAIVGPKTWLVSGTQPVAITGSNYLRIDDTSAADEAIFYRIGIPNPWRQDYITEYEYRIAFSNLDANPNSNFGVLGAINDGLANTVINFTRLSGVLHIGIYAGQLGPYSDPSNYVDLQPFDFDGRNFHARVVFDRDQTPVSYGKVEVFIDYSETPILSGLFYDAPPSGALPFSLVEAFGTETGGTARLDIDYLAVRSYKKLGQTFKAWEEWDFNSNAVVANLSDPDIVKPVTINPPGITAGQSRYALELDVQDSTQLCEVFQIDTLPDPSPQTYKIAVDYKMDQAVVEGELVVQRTSDLWYWDETGGVWSATFSSVTLPNSATRIRFAAMTGISVVDVSIDAIRVTVKAKTATPPAYKILVYKVFLDRE